MKYKFMILALVGLVTSSAMAQSEVCHTTPPPPPSHRHLIIQYNEWSQNYTINYQQQVGQANYVAQYVVDQQVGGTKILTKLMDFSSDSSVLPEKVALNVQANQPNNYMTLSSEGLFSEAVTFQKANCRDPDAPKLPACPYRPHCL